MRKAVAYIRVSTPRQALEGESLDAQTARITAFCIAHTMELVGVVREEGVTSSIPLVKRPKYPELQAHLAAGATCIVVVKLDRIFRTVIETLNSVAEYTQQGISIHALDAGGAPLDTSSAMGSAMLSMRAIFGQLERDLARERTRETMAYMRAQGQRVGQIPWGHNLNGDHVTPHPQYDEALNGMRIMRGRGYSLRTIAGIITSDYPELAIGHQTVNTILTTTKA